MNRILIVFFGLMLLLKVGSADLYNDGQLGSIAKEQFEMGRMIGSMNAEKDLLGKTYEGAMAFNEMVPLTNKMIDEHNALMIKLFNGNITLLSSLLIPHYDPIPYP